jgi:hypothetical protein
MLKPTYHFSVNSVDQIDVPRILREANDSDKIIILADNVGKPIVVFLRVAFLARFIKSDKILLSGEALHPMWGYSNCVKLQQSAEKSFAAIHYLNIHMPNISPWRCREANSGNTVCKILAEFDVAINFRRKISVCVYKRD